MIDIVCPHSFVSLGLSSGLGALEVRGLGTGVVGVSPQVVNMKIRRYWADNYHGYTRSFILSGVIKRKKLM